MANQRNGTVSPKDLMSLRIGDVIESNTEFWTSEDIVSFAVEITQAMRQPDESQIDAVYRLPITCITNHDVSREHLIQIWQAMIDDIFR